MPAAVDDPRLVFVLDNTIRRYPWGSTTHLPRFLGHPASTEPAAELWMGAHAGDPSRLPDGGSLLAAIEADPQSLLGPDVAEAFGPRLPFLMKVLAAAEPLSLQVHPSSARAREGFAREQAGGVPVDAADRNYRDDSHKPELIYALTRFEGMAGFRDPAGTTILLRLLGDPYADAVAARLEADPGALRAVATEMLRTPRAELPGLLAQLGEAARAAEARLHREGAVSRSRAWTPDLQRREALRVLAMLPALIERYPDDPGVLVLLLLNHVVLAPGESMYLDAGVVHAYTSGLGVEIMASSDNVLRAGLTTKHTDVDELLEVTDFTPIPAPYQSRVGLGPDAEDTDLVRIEPPVAEFALTVAVAPVPVGGLPATGPRIVLVLEGEVEVVTDAGRLAASRGDAVFVAHAAGGLEVRGRGRVAVGAVPGAAGADDAAGADVALDAPGDSPLTW